MAKSFEEILQEELARPVHRSPQFWVASVLLGGSPAEVAPHLPGMSEQQVADKLADAVGKMFDEKAFDEKAFDEKAFDEKAFDAEPACSPVCSRETIPGGPSGYTRSSWGMRRR